MHLKDTCATLRSLLCVTDIHFGWVERREEDGKDGMDCRQIDLSCNPVLPGNYNHI